MSSIRRSRFDWVKIGQMIELNRRRHLSRHHSDGVHVYVVGANAMNKIITTALIALGVALGVSAPARAQIPCSAWVLDHNNNSTDDSDGDLANAEDYWVDGYLTAWVPSWHSPESYSWQPTLGRCRFDMRVKLGIGLAQGGFHVVGRVGLGEQEAEVAVPLGQWLDLGAGRDGDAQVDDSRYSACLGLAAHFLQTAGAGHRQHHHASRPALALQASGIAAKCVLNYQLFQADPGAEPQHARTQAADGARGDL